MTEDKFLLYPSIHGDGAMRNAFMQDQEARDLLMELMFRRSVRNARCAA